MFNIALYIDADLTEDQVDKLLYLARRVTERKEIPFGSHCYHIATLNKSDTYKAFKALSHAGLNVSLCDVETEWAVSMQEPNKFMQKAHTKVLRL